MTQRLTLIVSFRETGWRRPLRDPVALEVWSAPDAQLLVTLPASYLEELVRTHLTLSDLQARFAAYRAPATLPDPPDPQPSRPRGYEGPRRGGSGGYLGKAFPNSASLVPTAQPVHHAESLCYATLDVVLLLQ